MSEANSKTPETPEDAKWLAYIVHHVRANWDVLVKPPVGVAVVVFFVGGFWVANHLADEHLRTKEDEIVQRNGVISLKDERIGFLNDQIAAYKDRLQGATPDQAAKQISELQDRLNTATEKLQVIDPDSYRTLKQSEIDYLTSHQEELKKDIKGLFIYSKNIGDSSSYAYQFFLLFSKLQIPIMGASQAFCSKEQRGILVGLRNLESPSPEAQNFIKILKDAGLGVGQTKWESEDKAPQDFDLFICN